VRNELLVELEFPPALKINPVVHVEKLKLFKEDAARFPTRRQVNRQVAQEGRGENREYEVERIVAERVDERGLREYLVLWVGYGLTDASWEPEENLANAPVVVAAWKRQQRETAAEQRRENQEEEKELQAVLEESRRKRRSSSRVANTRATAAAAPAHSVPDEGRDFDQKYEEEEKGEEKDREQEEEKKEEEKEERKEEEEGEEEEDWTVASGRQRRRSARLRRSQRLSQRPSR
jgi:hypothetical protein